MIFDLASDFSAALAAMPEAHPRHRILRLLEEAIRRDVHFIDRHPTTLFQCMWNTCWWYDCPEVLRHYRSPAGEKLPDHPASANTGPKLFELLESWRKSREAKSFGACWLRSLRPPPQLLGSSLERVFLGHETSVTSVAYSQALHACDSRPMDHEL